MVLSSVPEVKIFVGKFKLSAATSQKIIIYEDTTIILEPLGSSIKDITELGGVEKFVNDSLGPIQQILNYLTDHEIIVKQALVLKSLTRMGGGSKTLKRE